MSNVLSFSRGQARASSSNADRLRAAKSARISNVMSDRSHLAANATIAAQCADGMPRLRHPLTVGSTSDNSLATAPVPPRAVMIESQVMDENVVCTMQTCQEFASRKTTFGAEYGAIGAMVDTPKVIGNRLEALRKELGIKTQDAFAEKLGIDKSTYSLIKNGRRNLSFETACVARQQWGVSIDWLFFGDLQKSAIQMMARIGRGADEPASPQKRKAG
jgi:DNA-binding XRE family transcriptional regulator